MPQLRRSKSGAYIARGRVPSDVRDEYGRRFGKSLEVRFYAASGTKLSDAKRLYGEWLAEHEARVASIRAERSGGGIALTQRRAIALAAEWYRWFVAKHADDPGEPDVWEHRRDAIGDELREHISPDAREYDAAVQEDEAIEIVLPRIADDAETQQVSRATADR